MHSWCPDCFKNWMLLPSVPFSSLSVTQAPKHTCSTQISPHPWEPSLSNGDILTYFELGNHWSYKQSFWHLNSSWDNDLSPRSWYLARPVSSCLLQLQCLWISQFFKPLAGEFEELQEGYACCLATKKLSSQNASPLLPRAGSLSAHVGDQKAKVRNLRGHLGWRDFIHIPLAIWMQLPL